MNTPWQWLSLLWLVAALTAATSAAASPTTVTSHSCSARQDELVVESIWLTDHEVEDVEAALARPLPAGARLIRTGEHPTRLQVRMPLKQLDNALPLPIPAGDGQHRVAVDRSLDFVPDPALGLVLRVDHHATTEVDSANRRHIDATLGGPTPAGAYYLDSGRIDAAGGFVGDLMTRKSRDSRNMWLAVIAFALCAAGMGLGYWRLSKRAELERAEQVLAAHFSELEKE